MGEPWVLTVVYGAGSVVLIVLAGAPPILTRATSAATAAEGVAYGVRWAVLFVTLIAVVPSYKKVFDDFGVSLPYLTEISIRASDTATVWMPGLLLVGAGMTILFHQLYRDPARRPLAKGLSLLTTAASSAAVVGVVVSLYLPMVVIGNDLS